MKVYLASGWFTEEQEKLRQEALTSIILSRLNYYSPKDEGQYVEGKKDPETIFSKNILQITFCDLIVASPGVSSGNRDTGTVFECGYAYATHKPIVYYYPTDSPLNLMIELSGVYTARTQRELTQYLTNVYSNNRIIRMNYERGLLE